MEEADEPVVVEPAEPVAGQFDLLDDQVQGFGGPVGCAGEVVVEDLGALSGEGASEGRMSRTSSPVQATMALSRRVTASWRSPSPCRRLRQHPHCPSICPRKRRVHSDKLH